MTKSNIDWEKYGKILSTFGTVEHFYFELLKVYTLLPPSLCEIVGDMLVAYQMVHIINAEQITSFEELRDKSEHLSAEISQRIAQDMTDVIIQELDKKGLVDFNVCDGQVSITESGKVFLNKILGDKS